MGVSSLSNLTQAAVPTYSTHPMTQWKRSAPMFPYTHAHMGGMPPQVLYQSRMTPLGTPRRPMVPLPLRRVVHEPPALYDPLGFLYPKPTRKSSREETYATKTTTEAPPLVYFPDGEGAECGDYSSHGFDTYSFVGFLLGVVNLVAQVLSELRSRKIFSTH